MPRRTDALHLDQLLAHGDFVRALAHGLIRDHARAEDVVQDTLVAALEHPPPRGQSASQVRAWLATVARNFARQSVRREGRWRAREERSARPEGLPSTATIVQREATRRAVVEALLALDETSRDTLLLRYYDDLPPREIARRLAMPVETVRTRLRRGLARLRARLDTERPAEREDWALALAVLAAQPRVLSGSVPSTVRFGATLGLAIAATTIAVWWMRATSSAAGNLAHWADPAASEPGGAPAPSVSADDAIAPVPAPRSRQPVEQPVPALTEPAAGSPEDAGSAQVRYAIVPPQRQVAGQVVDERGQPVADALVYAGNQIRARGDEPFKPFQALRVQAGVRTDATGRFELSGQSRWITAWHEDIDVVTVAWESADRIALHDPVDLRGRLVDGGGNPIAGGKVALDRGAAETTTAADGSFAFESVPVGVHGLRIEGSSYYSVELPPGGREPFVVVGVARRTEIELRSGVDRLLGQTRGVWLGLAAGSPILELGAEAGLGEVQGLVAGPYLLLLPESRAVPVDVPEVGDSLSVDLGTAEVEVRGPPGTRVYLLPAGSSELAQLMAGRVCSTAIPAGGELRLARLREGRYEIGIDREGILGPVEIGSHGARVVLE